MPREDTQFKPGQSGNPSGRPKNSLKSYLKLKLSEMTAEEKANWLKQMKISGELQWRMAEGNPANELEHSGEVTSKIVSIDE